MSSGLTLQAVHQEGKVPKIVAKIKTGGDRIDVNRAITPPTAAEQAKIQDCLARSRASRCRSRRQGGGGANPRRRARRPAGEQAPAGAASAAARSRSACPSACSGFRATITTPRETLQQVLDPPQTDITSESYTIGGVELGDPDDGRS